MKYLKNLTEQKLLVQDLKFDINPNSISPGLTEEEIKKSKDVQIFRMNEKIEVVDMDDKKALEIRKKNNKKQRKKKQKINNAYLENVTSDKPESRNASSSNQFQNQVMKGAQRNDSPAPPEAGSVATGNGQPQSIDEMAEQSQNQLKQVAQQVESAKQKKEVKEKDSKSESKDTEAKVEEVSAKPEELKQDKPNKEYEEEVSIEQEEEESTESEETQDNSKSRIEQFYSLPFFTKKSEINSLEDIEFVKELLDHEDNDTVISLLEQKLEELE